MGLRGHAWGWYKCMGLRGHAWGWYNCSKWALVSGRKRVATFALVVHGAFSKGNFFASGKVRGSLVACFCGGLGPNPITRVWFSPRGAPKILTFPPQNFNAKYQKEKSAAKKGL